MNLGFISDAVESVWDEGKRAATKVRDEYRRIPIKTRQAMLNPFVLTGVTNRDIPIIGDAIKTREAAEEQNRRQEEAAAAAIEAAKTAEAESIAAAKAKTDEERRRWLAYGRESTFVSGGLAGLSTRKTLLGD